MPFAPRFTITNPITAALTAIERARGFLEAATLSEDWLGRMSQRALLLEAHHTTHIEGTHLTLDEAARLWAGEQVQGASRDDVHELLNYREAFTSRARWWRLPNCRALSRATPLQFKGQHLLNAALGGSLLLLIILLCATQSAFAFWMIVLIALALGFLLILPIGGADMSFVISMLNSYSGWAAAGIGFTLQNPLLIITGALVGASGAILSYIMCKGMNRSIFNVILGGFGADAGGAGSAGSTGDKTVKSGSAEDAAYIMKNATSVIIVPGYGMAVAQAQHSLREMADLLKKEGVQVRYAIHPVAGRMPGHMNRTSTPSLPALPRPPPAFPPTT